MTEKITDKILSERLSKVTETVGSYPDSFNEALALEAVNWSAEESWIDYRYRVGKAHLNLYGAVHGGVIASLADDAGGAAACVFSDAYVSTATLAVEYLTAMNRSLYIIHVEVPHAGRRIVNTMIKIKEEQTGRICATAVASFAVMSDKVMPEY